MHTNMLSYIFSYEFTGYRALFWSLMLCVCLQCNKVMAQTQLPTDMTDFLLFYSTQEGEPILVTEDNRILRGKNLEHVGETNFPVKLNIKDFKKHHLIIGDYNYFIDEGCGPVLRYKNGHFERIDHSFKHRNQYKSICFEHDQRIYLWGGYGLFTPKNILTVFSNQTKDWKRVFTHNTVVPPKLNPAFIKTDNSVYIFGGDIGNDQEHIGYKREDGNRLYILNLSNMNWEVGPIIKNKYLKLLRTDKKNYFVRDKILHIVDESKITTYNIKENEVTIYDFQNPKDIIQLAYLDKADQLAYVYQGANKIYYFNTTSFNEFLGHKVILKDTLFIETINKPTLINISLAILLILLFIFLGLSKVLEKKSKSKLILKCNKIDKTFSYMGENLETLDPIQQTILCLLIKNSNHFTSMSTINEEILISNPGLSYIATNKRRERSLVELKKILSVFLKKDERKVFLERKSKLDKRIKEIKLNVQCEVIE